MDVDAYRLAYNVFYRNWERFGIPPEDIPPPKTEIAESLDTVIPGFSIAVALFQIASRKDLKTFLDNECLTVHNLSDVYTRFENVMRQALPNGAIGVNSPNDTVNEGQSEDATNEDVSPDMQSEDATNEDVSPDIMQSEDALNENVSPDTMQSEDATNEDVSPNTIEEYLSEDVSSSAVEVDLLAGIEKDNLPNDAMEECLQKDFTKKCLLEDVTEKSLPGNGIRPEDIPGLIAYSLAVCTELVLYEREKENNTDYMKSMPDMWEKYFDKNLKPLCEEAKCSQDHLQAYSKSIKCPERFLNKFVAENKNEYSSIADKFYGYTEENVAVESPEHSKFITEVRNFPKGLSFMKMKETFTAFKEICKCVTVVPVDEIPLLDDYSPGGRSSSSTTPSI